MCVGAAPDFSRVTVTASRAVSDMTERGDFYGTD